MIMTSVLFCFRERICAGLAVKHGLPMEEGLKAITINAAKICGVDDMVDRKVIYMHKQ